MGSFNGRVTNNLLSIILVNSEYAIFMTVIVFTVKDHHINNKKNNLLFYFLKLFKTPNSFSQTTSSPRFFYYKKFIHTLILSSLLFWIETERVAVAGLRIKPRASEMPPEN